MNATPFHQAPRWIIGAAAVLFLGMPAGCHRETLVDLAPRKVPADQTVVTVNGEPLSVDEFDTEFRLMRIHYNAVSEGDMRAIKRRLFEQVINRRILVEEARKDGMKLTQTEVDQTFRDASRDMPEDSWTILRANGVSKESWKRKLLQERLARKLVDREVNSKVRITPQEVEEYYWSHLPEYWDPAAVRARHLVVQRRSDLQKVLAGLQKKEEFSKLASTFSLGLERTQGGDWGYMTADRLPSDYWKALGALKPGEVSKPIKDEFGYHLFQLEGWRPRRMRSFAEVRDRIYDSLLKEEQEHRFDQWMAELKKKADIKVNEEMAPVVGVTLED